jgi:hypothetical protein
MNYYQLPSRSVIAKELLEFALDNQEWTEYYNFKAVQVPLEILIKDPFLVSLFHKHTYAAGIVQLPPNACYGWHIDTRRGAGVNMLLNFNGFSNCLFAKGDGVQFEFEELKYAPGRYYLFNTQTKHMVLNFDEPRYLFTIEFEADNTQLSFDDLLAQLKNPAV